MFLNCNRGQNHERFNNTLQEIKSVTLLPKALNISFIPVNNNAMVQELTTSFPPEF